uniref:NG peptide n=1 Tax=Ophionotus victoriae TaxID=667017 RepID=A0A0D5MEP6_9ECHI|nr:NG peptide precursor [Ophionotus victoriae]ASK86254.1 NG peptide/neuropeptide-s precursor [Ophionotus victoriae]
MAVGIRNVILHLILVLYVARTILGEIDTYKVRRYTDGSPVNSNHWTQSDNINELRKEIFASLPADLPGIIHKSKTHDSRSGRHSDELSNLEQLGNVAGKDGANDAKDKLALYNFMSKQATRNNLGDELDKRNGFFFGKRNGFFYGKRDVEAVNNEDSCVRCGPENRGQCVMFGTCCSPQFGCYLMTKESEACMSNHIGTGCRNLDMAPQCGSTGVCVAKGVCCSPQDGACHIDVTSCLSDNTTIDKSL